MRVHYTILSIFLHVLKHSILQLEDVNVAPQDGMVTIFNEI